MTRLRHFGEATPILRYSNWIAAGLVTLFATYLHVLFLLNAGGLWRDEADLVHLSLLPSVSEVWQNLPHGSCPILMHLAVRAWSAAASTLLIIEQTHPFASLSQPNNCIPLRTFG
jgi:hypothetical protein